MVYVQKTHAHLFVKCMLIILPLPTYHPISKVMHKRNKEGERVGISELIPSITARPMV